MEYNEPPRSARLRCSLERVLSISSWYAVICCLPVREFAGRDENPELCPLVHFRNAIRDEKPALCPVVFAASDVFWVTRVACNITVFQYFIHFLFLFVRCCKERVYFSTKRNNIFIKKYLKVEIFIFFDQ